MSIDETILDICHALDLIERRLTAVEDKLASHMTQTSLETIRQDQAIQRQTSELSRGMQSLISAINTLQVPDGLAVEAGTKVASEIEDIVRRRRTG